MREGWNRYKIEELGRVVTGKTPLTQNPNNFGGKYPFIPPKDMLGQKKIRQTERYLSEEGKTSIKNCLLPANSICVSCIGSDMGKVVMTTIDSITNQQLNSISCSNLFDPDFVYYALVNISAELKNAGHHSTAVPILNKTDFSSFEIDAPGRSTQCRIAAILSSVDEKIELNRQTNQTLEAIAQSLFKAWFLDFNFPGSTGEMQESELGPIPIGWEVSTLKNLTVKIGSGATPRGGSGVYLDEGTSLIRSQNVYDSEFVWDGLARISDDAAEQLRNVEVQQEDVLLNIMGASILRTCVVVPEVLPARVNQHVAIIRANTGISSRYIHLHLLQQKTKDYLMALDAGGSRETVTKGHIELVPILKPPLNLLARFDAVTSSMYSEIEQLSSQIRALASIRDILLPKLMGGEIVPVLDPKGFQKPLGSGVLRSASQKFSDFFNAYAKAINQAYGRTGSLFQHPFGRIPITSDRQFWSVVAYIHQNPQKHKFVEDFREWKWFSYAALLTEKPTRLRRTEVLEWFSGRERYEELHAQWVTDAESKWFAEDDAE